MKLLTAKVIRRRGSALAWALACAWAVGAWRGAAAAPDYPDVRCGQGACDGEESAACQALAWRCDAEPDADADPDAAPLLRLPAVAPCSCCDFCLRQLPANATCWKGSPLEAIPAAVCGPRLFCSEELRCAPMATPCVQQQTQFDAAEAAGAVGVAEARPRCTDDGRFGPVRCARDGLCYCVEPEEGSRIFGEAIFTTEENADSMTCGCSLFLWEAGRVLAGLEAEAAVAARCAADGSFSALQCAEGDERCACVGGEDGALQGEAVARERRAALPCYDPDADGDSACEAQRRKDLALVAAGALGVYPPRCDPDGSFARWQRVAGGGWRCVDPEGAPIDAFASAAASASAAEGDCRCARARWRLSAAAAPLLPACCADGAFRRWQCRGDRCFCVDGDGAQAGADAPWALAQQLPCFRDACPADSFGSAPTLGRDPALENPPPLKVAATSIGFSMPIAPRPISPKT